MAFGPKRFTAFAGKAGYRTTSTSSVSTMWALPLLVLALFAPRGAPQTFTLLSGYLRRTYSRGAGCAQAPFYEAIEQVGVCLKKYDSSGKAVGSMIRYLCGDEICYSIGRETTEDTSEPTLEPTLEPTSEPTRKTTKPTARPTKVPSARPSLRAPSAAAAAEASSLSRSLQDSTFDLPGLFVQNKTFIGIRIDYDTLNCSSQSSHYNFTMEYPNPDEYVQAGACRNSTPATLGQFMHASFVEAFFPTARLFLDISVGLPEVNLSPLLGPPPALTVQGYTTSWYVSLTECARAGLSSWALYSFTYPFDKCLPGDEEFYPSVDSSFRFVNNLDWRTQVSYSDSTSCSGSSSKILSDLAGSCSLFPSEKSATIHYKDLGPMVLSVQTTSPSPAYLEALLQKFAALCSVEKAIAAISALTSFLILLLLFDMKKWTDINRIVLVLTASQLVFDLSFLASRPNSRVIQGSYTLGSQSSTFDKDTARANYHNYMVVDFFKLSSMSAACFVSNILSFVVAYIVLQGHFSAAQAGIKLALRRGCSRGNCASPRPHNLPRLVPPKLREL